MNSIAILYRQSDLVAKRVSVQIARHISKSYSCCNKQKMSEPSKYYDIVIAGGGMVGTAMASAIARNSRLQNKTVLLLEGAPNFKGFNDAEVSNRVSALNKGTKELLSSIGAWDIITTKRYKPVKRMQVWDALSDAIITFNHENLADDVCYIVENDLIVDSILKSLSTAKNIEIRNGARIESCMLVADSEGDQPNTLNRVALQSGETYECELLIGADGANSLIRKELKDKHYYAQNYKQMGVVATVELDTGDDDNTMAWQRFLPTGPVALLPLTNNLSSLVWSTTPEQAKQLISMTNEEFVDALNLAYVKEYPHNQLTKSLLKMVDNIVGGGGSNKSNRIPPRIISVRDKSRAGFPLGFGVSSIYAKTGVALIGDAAHRVHPLAGQGVNIGFGDVKCLVEQLSSGVYAGAKLGALTHLLKYEQARLQSSVPLMVGIHGIKELYGTSFEPIVAIRSVGLKLTDQVPMLKKFFMEKAMA